MAVSLNIAVIALNGRLVEDVTEGPAFKGTINSMAQLYDLQHAERYRDFALYESPTTGDLVSSSFMIPRTHEELVKKRQTVKLRTDHTTSASWATPWTS